MENAARRKWLTFRQYKFKGVTIEESPERIRFSQTVPFSERKPNRPFKITRTVMLILLAGISALAFATAGPVVGGATLIGGFFVVAFLMLFVTIFAPPVIVVDVFPGQVRIHDGYSETRLNVGDIQNVDVQGGPKDFTVYVWHGPIPIQTLSQETQHNAIGLREGLMAAIAMMSNPEIEDDVITPGQVPPPPPRRKTFEE